MGFNLFGNRKKIEPTIRVAAKKKVVTTTDPVTSIPAGRVSKPHDTQGTGNLLHMGNNFNIVNPDFTLESIPLIRSLYKTNEDLGGVLFDLIQLTNTGHEIKFDQSLSGKAANAMRDHIKEKSKKWGYGTAGIDGLVNKMIAQIWIGGALSFESVPDNRLTGIKSLPLINPETIRFKIKKSGDYEPYQKVKNAITFKQQYIKLNTNTYTYYSLYGDEDTPYGVPPFLTALSSLSTQKDMKKNINHILKQLGLLGYLEAKLAKPQQRADESETKYGERLVALLTEAKNNLTQGFLDGIVVGFDEDHEFEFNSTTKNLAGVKEVFDLNENQVANGLKTTGAFLGLDGRGGEGQLGIVFTKMLSQLKNVQDILSEALAKVYELELKLAGFDFKGLEVSFYPSTIADELKLWQGKEIKQRVLHNLWVDGIIGPDQYAYNMQYKKPFRKVTPPEPGGTDGSSAKKKEDREKDKDKSDRKVRDKNNPQPKRRDTDTKSR